MVGGVGKPVCTGEATFVEELDASVFPSSAGNGGRSLLSTGLAARTVGSAVCAGAVAVAELGVVVNVELSVSLWVRSPELFGWSLLFASGGKEILSRSITVGFVEVAAASGFKPAAWTSPLDPGGGVDGPDDGVLISTDAGAVARVLISTDAGAVAGVLTSTDAGAVAGVFVSTGAGAVAIAGVLISTGAGVEVSSTGAAEGVASAGADKGVASAGASEGVVAPVRAGGCGSVVFPLSLA